MHSILKLVPLLLITLLCTLTSVHSLRYYEMNITSARYNPDCSDHQSSVLMINNQLPGIPIYLHKGERVQIMVRNNILPDRPVFGGVGMVASIHFHGIKQLNSVQSDGVPHLTQQPIQPGESFLYDFEVPDQVGTFFYHAHVGLQEMSVFGPIIIYDSKNSDPATAKKGRQLRDGPFRYDDERIVALSEWWHTDRGQFEAYFRGTNFTNIFEAETYLVNGQGIYDTGVDLDSYCRGYAIIPVDQNKTYRLRVIGGMSFRTLGFAIAGHTMTVIEVDGDYIKPYDVDYLEVSPGQRFSVLITTNNEIDDYGINLQRRWSKPAVDFPTNGHAILQYRKKYSTFKSWSFNDTTDQPSGERILSRATLEPSFPLNDTIHWKWNNMEPYYDVHPVVKKDSNRTIILKSALHKHDGLTRFYINGVSFPDHNTTVILHDIVNQTRPLPAINNRDPITGYDKYLETYPMDHMEILDVVIQNTRTENEPCRSHPWHTHGHSHWEIAYGEGEYNHTRDGHIRNVPNPILKDLTLVYPNKDERTSEGPGEIEYGCGWAKIRMLADNPGVWAMHCHNIPHAHMGMMIAFEESPELIGSGKSASWV
ncbi:Cupredoxin [Pilaira anomala]|nr:Cupredoxin [Pilaira anomala]